MSFSRRSFLGAAGLLAGGFTLPGFKQVGRPMRRPKNIIFCVADGMAMSTMTMADQFQRVVYGRPSYWSELTKKDYALNGLQVTESLNSLVTDSSAAASAWGCGRLIWNGQVNEYPDGTKLKTLCQIMQEKGIRTGLVTTTTITHATPAGFAVNMKHRGMEAEIAAEYLKVGVDVLMGGGSQFFQAARRKDGRDLFAEFSKASYTVARNRDEMLRLGDGKLLGIFSSSHMPFTVDHVNSPELMKSTPTLVEMTRIALSNLRKSPNGFLLQIEGGKVDHGAHANDLAAMLYDQIAFEEAVKEAIEFALEDGETVVVVTTDHACGGPALNGAGHEYIESTDGLKRLAGMKASYGPINQDLAGGVTASRVREVVEARLGIALTPAEAEAVVSAAANKPPFGDSIFYRSVGATLAMVLGNHTKITWTSGNHTSDHVLVTAVGPGKEAFAGLRHSNTYFDTLLSFKGLSHSNPKMTFEEAAKHYEKIRGDIPPEAEAHWSGSYAGSFAEITT
ncbi:MAG TPA: alkaline phosphatase [Fimbriimonadaceae bacterium]|nr:alkaline phosphatase [Fimbriimonadaceae bacterium]